jgi:mutator protein MutT
MHKKNIAAGIIEKDGKFLIAQRAKNDSLKGLWEFPGGKVENDETLQECLRRELYEELNIHATVAEHYCISSFEHNNTLYDMHMFKVYQYEGQMQLHEHAHVAWVSAPELSSYQYPQPDLPVVALLQKDYQQQNSI